MISGSFAMLIGLTRSAAPAGARWHGQDGLRDAAGGRRRQWCRTVVAPVPGRVRERAGRRSAPGDHLVEVEVDVGELGAEKTAARQNPDVDVAVKPMADAAGRPAWMRRACVAAGVREAQARRRASPRKTAPAAVSSTLRLSRSSRWAPTARSSSDRTTQRRLRHLQTLSRSSEVQLSDTATKPRSCSSVKHDAMRVSIDPQSVLTRITCHS